MHFSFTEDQAVFREAVTDLFVNECPPAAVRAARDSATGTVPGLWAKLTEMGVVGLLAPEGCGGLGLDECTLVTLLEEAGRAACPEPLIEHTAVALPALAEAGRDDIVAAAAAGELVVTTDLGGSHVPHGQAGGFVLAGADDGLYFFTAAEVSTAGRDALDPSRRLTDVEPRDGAGTRLAGSSAERAFDRGALATAAQAVGVAQQLLDATVTHVSERHQFGRPVGSYQAVKHHLANVALAVALARPLVYRAAWCVAVDDADRSRDVSAAKAVASDAVDLAGRLALQCHGAIGYTDEHDLQLWLKRGWTLAASYRSAAWHRDRVAQALGI